MALSTQGAETAEVTEAAETSTTALPVVLAQAVVHLLCDCHPCYRWHGLLWCTSMTVRCRLHFSKQRRSRAGAEAGSVHNAFLCNELMRIASTVLKKFNGLADGANQAVMQELPQLLDAVLTPSISHASKPDQESKQRLAKRTKGITGCAREVVAFIAKAKVLDASVDSAFILLPCGGLAAGLEQLISTATSGATVAGAASSANDATNGGEGDGQMKQQKPPKKNSKKAKKDKGPEGVGRWKSVLANNVVVQLRQAVGQLCGITEVEGGGGGAEAGVGGSCCNGAAAPASASKPSIGYDSLGKNTPNNKKQTTVSEMEAALLDGHSKQPQTDRE